MSNYSLLLKENSYFITCQTNVTSLGYLCGSSLGRKYAGNGEWKHEGKLASNCEKRWYFFLQFSSYIKVLRPNSRYQYMGRKVTNPLQCGGCQCMSNPLMLLPRGKQSIAWRRQCYPTCGVSQPVPTIIALMEENFDKRDFLAGSTAIEWLGFADWKLPCLQSQRWLDVIIAPPLFIFKVIIMTIYSWMKIVRIWNQVFS